MTNSSPLPHRDPLKCIANATEHALDTVFGFKPGDAQSSKELEAIAEEVSFNLTDEELCDRLERHSGLV